MPPRRCLYCHRNAINGDSRCQTHRGKPRGPRRHDANHDRLAKQVKAVADLVCAVCGKPGTPNDPLEAGHIIPLSQGGQSVPSNYRLEHRSHNRGQGAKLAYLKRRG